MVLAPHHRSRPANARIVPLPVLLVASSGALGWQDRPHARSGRRHAVAQDRVRGEEEHARWTFMAVYVHQASSQSAHESRSSRVLFSHALSLHGCSYSLLWRRRFRDFWRGEDWTVYHSS